ncbi:unnamed protein product [Anisakis simplex]|uniref:Integrator complex subunit 2 (inferred by orthology to a human protein) n=1 Tax=Anisakis simplex TaxID=6269 RepID=A0A158PPH8_ANISI|nr:unnamed protein product [Anisakis simplex]
MNFKTVYEAIKNGSIINRIEEFSCEELKPFLPVLAFAAFSAQDEASSDVSDSLDKLRSRLMEFKQCNSLVELVNVDVDRIIDDLINNPSDINLKINLRCASPYDKVKMIAYALLKIPSSTVLSNANISASATTFADMNLFDEQCSIDELICVMLMCVRRCPDKFDINLIIHALLPLPSAPDLITKLLCNLGDSTEASVEYLIALHYPDSSLLSKQRSDILFKLLGALIVVGGLELSSDETRQWILFITRTECADERYVCMALSIKLDIRSLTKIRSLFLRHATSERELIHKVSLLPVITKFNGSHKGFLSAHCITQLLTARSFAKHSIPIHEWISSQIVECTIPVHPAIVELITSYASSCLPIDSDCNVSEPLSQQFIQELFFGDMIDERRLVPRLLTLFFMLSLKYQLDKFDYSHHNNVSYPYKEEFECRLPIRYMIGVMNARPDDFHELRPQLLKVVSHFYAYMLPNANSFLYDINSDLRSSSFKTDGIGEVNATCEMELEMKCPMKSLALIEQFEWSRLQKQIHLRNFVLKTMNMVVDKQNMSDPFIKSLIYIWMRIENIETVQFVEETVQALSGLRITHEMLCMQPMLLYESNDYVFRNAPLFSCFLRILSFYQQDTRAEREELAKSLFGAQDSELVQMLLEVCCEFGDDKVKKLACDHIHQMFIADTSLLKLVHFQGYPLSMISMTVRLIPSMHACLDFVHDILALRDLTKRLFATLLIIELAKQASRILPFDEALAYLSLLIPSLSQIMDIFPQINDDISFLLSEISKLINDGMKASSTVAVTNDCHAQKLLDDIACVISKRGDIITYKCLGS